MTFLQRALAASCALGILLLAACSDDGADAVADNPANAPIAQVDAGSGGVAEAGGAISGLLTVQPSFGFGLYAVDPATGQGIAIPGIAAVDSIQRDADVIVQGNAAYALGGRPREGQTIASDMSLVKIDYTNSQASQLAALGFDRETDTSTEAIAYTLDAVTPEAAVVRQVTLGQDNAVYRVFDLSSGEQTSSFAAPTYVFENETGRCEGTLENLIGLSDGRLAGTTVGSPAIVDPATGALQPLMGCDQPRPKLGDLVAPVDLAKHVVFKDGSVGTPEAVETIAGLVELSPSGAFVEGNGDLWWISVTASGVNGVDAFAGGLVRYDLDSEAVEAVYPLGEHLASFTDCEGSIDACEVHTLQQAQLRVANDRVVVLDSNENGRVLVVDPSTGGIVATELATGDGVDFTRASLLAGDPQAVWLEVRRFTITSEDGAPTRTVSSTDYVERIDTTSGLIDVSLAAEDIFF